ncbi:hypothetical protein [Sphingobium chungangianum]|jgi:hypothetical protein
MRTSNDADCLLPPAKHDTHHALNDMIRSSHAEAICVSDEFNARSQVRALAALRPPAVMH